MCKSDEETNLHMFIKCPVIQRIWYVLANTLDFLLTDFISPSAALIWWSKQNGNRRFLILIFLWSVWKWRNAYIFTDSALPPSSIMDNFMTDWHMIYGSFLFSPFFSDPHLYHETYDLQLLFFAWIIHT